MMELCKVCGKRYIETTAVITDTCFECRLLETTYRGDE